jgi:hypothetical protein
VQKLQKVRVLLRCWLEGFCDEGDFFLKIVTFFKGDQKSLFRWYFYAKKRFTDLCFLKLNSSGKVYFSPASYWTLRIHAGIMRFFFNFDAFKPIFSLKNVLRRHISQIWFIILNSLKKDIISTKGPVLDAERRFYKRFSTKKKVYLRLNRCLRDSVNWLQITWFREKIQTLRSLWCHRKNLISNNAE